MKRIKHALFGAAAMLAMAGANAETISLIPLDPTVNVGDTIDITVRGTGFIDGVSGGSVTMTWDATKLGLVSSVADITASASSNGFPFDLAASVVSGQLDATYGTFSPLPGPAFDFFTVQFVALPPPSVSDVSIGLGLSGDWQNASDPFGIEGVNYVGTEVTVNVVPVPAAVWLFGSGLLGLVGIARRRNPQALA